MNRKICVIGGGQWGINHIKTLNKIGSLAAVVDNNAETKELIMSEFPHINFYSNVSDTFNEDYSGYVIATPAATHFKIAKELINKKKHILIEKPMTLNSSESQMLVSLARENNVNIMVGHLLLFHPAIHKIKEMVDLNKLGKLQYIYSNRLNLGTVRTEENVFWSLAPHDISILQYLTNSYPDEIESIGGAFLQKDVHDTTLTVLSYPDNVKCHIYVSWLHPFKEHRLVVIGSKGMLSFEDSSEHKDLIFYDKSYDLNGNVPEKIDRGMKIISYDKKMPLEEELRYFVNNLEDKFDISNGEIGHDVVKILEEATLSLNKKKAINV